MLKSLRRSQDGNVTKSTYVSFCGRLFSDPYVATKCDDDKTIGKSKLQVPDTGMSQYWSILEHFWCTSIARKCDPYVL